MNKQTYKQFDRHWIGSDLHLNHRNSLKYNAESRAPGNVLQCVTPGITDPFSDPALNTQIDSMIVQMNERIAAKWNAKVGKNDHVFLLGDLCMGPTSKMLDLLRQLNGYKTLILGNHDRSLMKLDGFSNHIDREKLGFLEVHNYLCFSPLKGMDVVMMHFPIASWDGMGRGSIHFHGHMHGYAPDISDYATKRIKDVGIDTNDLELYNFEEEGNKLLARPLPKLDHHGKPTGV